MEQIPYNVSYDAVFACPGSEAGNIVTYQILKTDGSVVTSGSAVFIAGSLWKVTFTPSVLNQIYIVVVNNTTLDVEYTGVYKSGVAVTVATPAVPDIPTTAVMLERVTAAIGRLLSGGAVAAYTYKGRNTQYMSLAELTKYKRELERQLSAESTTGSSGRNYAEF